MEMVKQSSAVAPEKSSTAISTGALLVESTLEKKLAKIATELVR
jgi:hypothetical protein